MAYTLRSIEFPKIGDWRQVEDGGFARVFVTLSFEPDGSAFEATAEFNIPIDFAETDTVGQIYERAYDQARAMIESAGIALKDRPLSTIERTVSPLGSPGRSH